MSKQKQKRKIIENLKRKKERKKHKEKVQKEIIKKRKK